MSPRTARRRSSSAASRRLTRCPIRSGWSRTWSSNSIRADLSGQSKTKRAAHLGRPFFIGRFSLAERLLQLSAELGQQLDSGVAVLQLVVEMLVAQEFHRLAEVLKRLGHPDAVVDPN